MKNLTTKAELENAQRENPEGEICGWCGKSNDFADDCGWFGCNPFAWDHYQRTNKYWDYDNPPEENAFRATCFHCYFEGEIGEKHRKYYGESDR